MKKQNSPPLVAYPAVVSISHGREDGADQLAPRQERLTSEHSLK